MTWNRVQYELYKKILSFLSLASKMQKVKILRKKSDFGLSDNLKLLKKFIIVKSSRTFFQRILYLCEACNQMIDLDGQ